jgi:hypothetical protein
MSGPEKAGAVFPGADETTPSRAEYFSWINNTNEGAAEAQTLANLAFFRWLHDEYGMHLDIYAFDAGALDGARFYGSTGSARFRRQFPRGFGPLAEAAAAFGGRLGLWAGPDGFGDTPGEEAARIETMVALCRDHGFALFKLDGVCGALRPEKEDAFVRQMTECRRHAPDLIVLNHRLKLGKGMPHATTFLWEGLETYVDVHIKNTFTAAHNRAGALARGNVPDLRRLTEDHGVCLSSCLDFWEDDLVLQAFGRCLVLAPHIYGNPWLLRDDEFPRLARLFNLHRRWRDILVRGMRLPEPDHGPNAVSRGDGRTRLLALRNLTWEPVRHRLRLDGTIGLEGAGRVELRRLHPHERVLGTFDFGAAAEVEVLPFRACLVLATLDACPEPAVEGCDFDVVRDVPGRPLEVRLLGPPGTSAEVRLRAPGRRPASARLDGADAPALARGQAVRVEFPGTPPAAPWHRKLGDLQPTEVPPDAEALYEATCFAADSGAAEVRELARSGPTRLPAVRAARDAFFGQAVLRRRFLDDAALFDGDPETAFAVCRRWAHRDVRVRGGAFRLDLGRPTLLDRLRIEVRGDYCLQPLKSQEAVWGAVSADLRAWRPVRFFADTDLEAAIPADAPVRYVRLDGCPDCIWEVRGYHRGAALDRTTWRASNLLAPYRTAPAAHAWSLRFTVPEAPPGSYAAVAVEGVHGQELAYAALRVADGYAGAPRRAPSFPANTWEVPMATSDRHYTYYVPLSAAMVGQPLEAVVLVLKGGSAEVRPSAWVTAYPIPFASRTLVVE